MKFIYKNIFRIIILYFGFLQTINNFICYKSCLYCFGEGNIYNHNCTVCNNYRGYYFLENSVSKNCYNENEIIDGYYLDKSSNLFKRCNNRCSTCNTGGVDSSSNCLKCNNINNYHFDPIKSKHCITFIELPNSNYYLDNIDDKYKLCHESCSGCDGPNDNDCTSCNGKTFFETEYFNKRCLRYSEIPENYYSFYSGDKFIYYKCHNSCKKCNVGGENKCLLCNIEEGYYPVEDKFGYCLKENQVPKKYYFDKNNTLIKKCYVNCSTCSEGFNNDTQEMNCDTCINGTYFQDVFSTNCVEKPKNRYYIDLHNGKETLFLCHNNCLTCEKGGNDSENNCLSCIYDLYFDDEKTTNCVDDDIECAIGCAKCYKNQTDNNLGILSADKRCKRCSFKTRYYPLERYSNAQFYVSCYPFNKSPLNYLFDENEKIHKLCYKTCATCFRVGNNSNHSCLSCDVNYIFIDEEPNNCFPQCSYYYYYNKYNQYKCTESDECPIEYPYLISNKSKCVSNCYNDNEYNLLFKNECFQNCPEGTSAYLYLYNKEFTAKCINSDEMLEENECKLDLKNNNKLEYDKITEDVLQQYAEEYVHNYPIVNHYVTSYSSSLDLINKYLIVIYKLEKCPREKVEGYIPLGLEECIDKVKTKNTIIQNIVVQIFYVIRKSAPPQINYYLYNPDNAEKLDLSACSGSKLAIKTSVFNNGNVDEQLVKYFSNLKINIFDITDPFFTDICFNFSKDGKDVPLDDRIELYYQNVSLCEDGCTYIGINFDTYEVECSCNVHNEGTNNNVNIAKTFLDNPLSNEVFGIITNSNIEVLKCIKKAFDINLIFYNNGGLMMIGLLIVQIIATVFIKFQIKKARNYIYSLIINLKFPPKRKINSIKFKNIYNFGDISNRNSRQSKDNLINYNYNNDLNGQRETNENNFQNKNYSFKNKNNNYYINKKNIKDNNDNLSKKQGSIKIFRNEEKYSYVKKASIADSTQYTNYTVKKKNNQNKSSNSIKNDNNTFINNINNSRGSGSGMGVFRVNSGESESALKNLKENIEEINDEYECNEFRENDENKASNDVPKKKFFEEVSGVGTYIGLYLPKKKSCSSFASSNQTKIPESRNNNIYENEPNIENGLYKNKKKSNNIPINEILLNNSKNIKVFNKNNNENIIPKNGENSLSKKNKKKSVEAIFLDLDSNSINSHNSKDNGQSEKILNLKNQLRKEIFIEIDERKKRKEKHEEKRKQIMVSYEHKEYNEKEINELDYEEAIIYDKRNFCQIFWYILKEKQTLINTFFVKDPLKPFSIKFLVIIFSFSCYFVINGFLYNEEYVSIKLKSKGNKNFYEYLSDSIERIFYTSIVGGVISFIISILFNTDKKIDKVINKNKKNKILLKGEIAKIYRCNNIRIISFIIIQFILMILFIIYIFCFCFVYQNNKLDWFESSLIIITIMQLISVFTSFLLSLFKYLSIKFQWELCFKLNTYLDDNV